METASSSGLEGVNAANTAISHVDGEQGRLVIAGYDVEQLAQVATFEEATRRVLEAGRAAPVDVTPAQLAQARVRAWELLPRLGDALDAADGMDALRAGLAHLRATSAGGSGYDDLADAITAIGAAPVFAAAWSRKQRGLAPIGPSADLDHASDYLRMTTGTTPSPAAAKALGAYLVTVSDHGMNASTFTARVVASTASDLISAVVAGVGALKGPLHGGAPGPVLDMLDAIGTPANAEAWLLGELAAGRRIMGMGHRIYRVRDPRAAVLEVAVKPLSTPNLDEPGFARRGSAAEERRGVLDLAHAVEAAAAKILRERKPDRPLAANVEFYTAVLLDAVGLPRGQFAPTFAVGRVAGWCAHVLEQRRVGKLIRPASTYVGPMPA